MWVFMGIIVVCITVFGGFVLSKGNIAILIQPLELLIIFGSAIGSTIISAGATTKDVAGAFGKAFTAKSHTKHDYVEILLFFYETANKARKEGLLSLESHFETPQESDIIKKYPHLLHNPRILSFICDNLKLVISVRIETAELNDLMDIDIEARIEEAKHPAHIVQLTGDAFPGLGIVAAVLGVIITMGFVSEPAEVIGHHVAVALAGTFFGILACYGFVGPLATNMAHHVKEEEGIYNMIKTCIIPLVSGLSPGVVVEYGRRVIPYGQRPTSAELEEDIKKSEGKA